MIVTAFPVTKSRTGKTFVVAMSVLGVVGAAQLAALGWAMATHQPRPAAIAPSVEPSVTVTQPAPFANPTPSSGVATTAAAPTRIDIGLAAPTPAGPIPTELPKPTPVQDEKPAVTAEGQVNDMVEQAKELRDRGDTGTALIRLREAQVIAPQNPQVIAELATTYESMGQTEKAMEYWRHIYDMGDQAGVYYTAAAAKVNPAPTAAATEDVPGIQPGMTLGLLDISTDDKDDADSARHLIAHIPIKARPGTLVDVRDVAVQVLFYDMLSDASVVQTNANINYRWSTAPVDWADSSIEVLDVEYVLPKGKTPADSRQYFGYIARVYYKGELQDWRANPPKLRQMFPPPTTLQQDGSSDQ
ncbi:MAG: alkyl sulfatase dimerization domain-containing protein [Chthoniobacteraceae bacterium]